MLSVSLVLFHSPLPTVQATLAAIARQELVPAKVYIHLNEAPLAESDAVARHLEQAAAPIPVEVSHTAENIGFTGAHNQLLAIAFASGAEAVLVLNPDVFLQSDALGALAEAAQGLGRPALWGPALELADPVTLEPTGLIDTLGIRWTRTGRHLDDRQGDPLAVLPADPIEVAGISGACLFVPRPAYEQIVALSGEFFDDAFFAYREDAELGLRAAALGVPSYVVPASRGRHVRRLRGTSREVDDQINRLSVRNRFLIAFKYGRRRPGGPAGAPLRDVVVLSAVLLRERSSIQGLREAWGLRHSMREKRARLRASEAAKK